jgi:uncharacterized membrane protein YedE/YeeE
MTNFTPVPAAIGGVLIGASASVLLLTSGRVAGISGILGSLTDPRPGDVAWRAAFIAGMIGAGLAGQAWWPEVFASTLHRSPAILALAGLLVGFGTRLGNGCTSGHGVCGLSRLSTRSLASVATFMAMGMFVAWLSIHALGVA